MGFTSLMVAREALTQLLQSASWETFALHSIAKLTIGVWSRSELSGAFGNDWEGGLADQLRIRPPPQAQFQVV